MACLIGNIFLRSIDKLILTKLLVCRAIPSAIRLNLIENLIISATTSLIIDQIRPRSKRLLLCMFSKSAAEMSSAIWISLKIRKLLKLLLLLLLSSLNIDGLLLFVINKLISTAACIL